jgi:hypothetical protein
MNKKDFPGSTMHGECWKAFVGHMHGKQYGWDPLLQAWHDFLAGWKAKCLQNSRHDTRHRTRYE